MSLPIVLEVAVGIIFIYLTLSLVASEVQEIISSLLQWRAEHLKYSIEQLLAGEAPSDKNSARQLADRLYHSALIRNLNYEAQGRLARFVRSILHVVGAVYRWVTRSRNVFAGDTSGPSYIPPETFAVSLLENLQLEQLQQVMTESRLRRFVRERISLPVNNIVNDIKASLGDEFVLSAELRHFEASLEQIIVDYQAQRVTLAQTLDRLIAELSGLADLAEQVLPEGQPATETFRRRLRYLRSNLLGNLDSVVVLLKQIQPTLQELIALLDNHSRLYRELVTIATQEGGSAKQMVAQLKTLQLPPYLQESLLTLAGQAQLKVETAEGALRQLQTEVEQWFEHGMTRASGVYKRNSKVVALLIGFAIAVIFNADTFHMVSRLSIDQAVRSSIVQSVDQLNPQTLAEVAGQLPATDQPETDRTETAPVDANQLAAELQSLGDAVSQTLEAYQLPMGRTESVLSAQQAAEASWPLPMPRRWFGWLITSLAIAMGSQFWFDALRRVVSVRSSGAKPTQTAPESK
ncbi:MAG: hypothetical protein F6J97_08240 [Leptolyngbya sp. SIO4C1]|nr:hypothetical protein [Leptolyngbya sp. SIO4C1]